MNKKTLIKILKSKTPAFIFAHLSKDDGQYVQAKKVDLLSTVKEFPEHTEFKATVSNDGCLLIG